MIVSPVRDPITVPTDEMSRVGEVRRTAVSLANGIELNESDQGRLALVATELATNLVRHAVSGEVVIRSLSAFEGKGVELLAVDRGPGMADVTACLRDGYSTAGTAGKGLGAIRRVADRFDVFSAAGSGTVLLARVHERSIDDNPSPACDVGVVSLPVAGEVECGDGWAVEQTPGGTAVLVVDGLGHGPAAATAAREAVRVFRTAAGHDSADVVRTLHAALRPTRGAAAAVAVIDQAARVVRFAGVGNVAGTIVGLQERQGLVSLSGTLGHEMRKVQVFEYPWPAGATLVLASDGLATSWDLARHPGLAGRHPSVIAGLLYREHRRGRDDVTVLVARDAEGRPSPP